MSSVLAPAVALALAAASPEGAPEQIVAVEGTQASAAEQAIQRHYQHLYAGEFEQALADVEALQPDDSNKAGQAFVASMRAAALFGLKRDKEARELVARMHQLTPNEPAPIVNLFEAALPAKRFDVAAEQLDELIAQYPDAVRALDRDLVNWFFRNEPSGQERRNEDRRIAMARIGYSGGDGQERWFAANAVGLLVKRGDFAGAAEFLPYVTEPETFENMLIQKRYSPLWPKIAQIAGPHLSKVRESLAANAERAYQAAPDDHQKLQSYVNALRNAGRLADAVALRSKLPASLEAMSGADEQMGWAVNNVALALHEAGKGDEADQVFAMLNEAPMPEEYWRVSMKINRLELLVTDGKFDRALPLIEPTANTKGSEYAEQLVRRLRYCALSGLGRKSEAEKYLPEMLSHAADAPQPTIDGLLCAGEIDRAEQLALSSLKNPDEMKRLAFEEDFVRALQPVPLTSDDPSVWQGRWAELRKRSAIAAAYAKLGRDMPAEFLPEKAGKVVAK